MTTILQETLDQLHQQYDIIDVIDLDPWHDMPNHNQKHWLKSILETVYKEQYQDNQRIVFTLARGDVYPNDIAAAGILLTQFQRRLNEVDISNFFVILLTTDQTISDAYQATHKTLSADPVPFEVKVYDPLITTKTTKKHSKQFNEINPKKYKYDQLDPMKVDVEDLSERHRFLLTESKRFCIYPWTHLHAYPNGGTYPCCMADMQAPGAQLGSMRSNTMQEIWNMQPMKDMRKTMLSEQYVEACNKCYEQESHGFISGRQSANKHFGHYVDRVDRTRQDGTFDEFELIYWDVRFSNLCNLKCRSCGHIFSSQWAQDQAKLAGPGWLKNNPVLSYAGRFETDAFDQLSEHIEHVEQIYFAGGEPLLMEEHYKILDELVKRKKFHVRLIYNTNFTHTDLKGKSVFEYWKLFDSVSVGASLDASGPRAEYIRKGTEWAVVEKNRMDMLKICPQVDFYISPTLSIMNALHLPDFHRDWVERGLISAKDLNVNILQDPEHYRIDIAPMEYKMQIKQKFEQHIEWLKDRDKFTRATNGFNSALSYMMATDRSELIPKFWAKTKELDSIRREDILEVIPELVALQ